MSEENKKIDSLKEKLFYTQKHASEIISDGETKKADEFCDGYMDFLRTAKTEREQPNILSKRRKNSALNRLSAAKNTSAAIKYI